MFLYELHEWLINFGICYLSVFEIKFQKSFQNITNKRNHRKDQNNLPIYDARSEGDKKWQNKIVFFLCVHLTFQNYRFSNLRSDDSEKLIHVGK